MCTEAGGASLWCARWPQTHHTPATTCHGPGVPTGLTCGRADTLDRATHRRGAQETALHQYLSAARSFQPMALPGGRLRSEKSSRAPAWGSSVSPARPWGPTVHRPLPGLPQPLGAVGSWMQVQSRQRPPPPRPRRPPPAGCLAGRSWSRADLGLEAGRPDNPVLGA